MLIFLIIFDKLYVNYTEIMSGGKELAEGDKHVGEREKRMS